MEGTLPTTFGYQITPNGWLATPEAICMLAERAERLHLSSLWFGDHVVIPRFVDSFYPYDSRGDSPFDPGAAHLEPLTALSFLAAKTSRVQIGMNVLVVPYRNPVLTASILSTIDVLSHGRLIVGVGSGWLKEEFEVLRAPIYEERGAVTDDYIRLFKALWTEDRPSFQGKYYNVADIGFQPRPTQRPHPPIWVGGDTDAALRRAAQLGDGWTPLALVPNSMLEPPEMADRIRKLRSMLRELGRDSDAFPLSVTIPVAFDPDAGLSHPLTSGAPEQIARTLSRYVDLGVRNFVVRPAARSIGVVGEHMERFVHEVVPLVGTSLRRAD
jgi:probable F420-dependent oxidoreductase